MKKDQELLEFIVKTLVDHPEDVKITRTVDEMGVLLTLSVNPQDMGKIIGRNGNTAKAIRTLLRIVGMQEHARVNLKIEEPGNSSSSSASSSSDSDASEVSEAMNEVVEDLKND